MSLNKALIKLEAINNYWDKKLGSKGGKFHWNHVYTIPELKEYIELVRKEIQDVFSILGALKYPGHKERQLVQSCIKDLTQAMERSERLYKHWEANPTEERSCFGMSVWTWTAQKNLKRLQSGKLRHGVKKIRIDDEVV